MYLNAEKKFGGESAIITQATKKTKVNNLKHLLNPGRTKFMQDRKSNYGFLRGLVVMNL